MFNFRGLDIPSPKPKHGIKLSSSKGDKVFPMTEMAFSYGLDVYPMALCYKPYFLAYLGNNWTVSYEFEYRV